MSNSQIRKKYLQAHIDRTKALKAVKKAQDTANQKSAQSQLQQTHSQVNATRKPYEQMLQDSSDPALHQLAASDQPLIKKSDAAYEQYQNAINPSESAQSSFSQTPSAQIRDLSPPQNANAANQSSPRDRLENIKKNRDALSSTLTKAQRQQAKGKARTSDNRAHRANYVLSHRFYVEMDGIIRAAFNECSGFGFDIKKELYLEGGVNDQQRLMLGHAEFQDTVLKRGMTNDPTFWLWIQEMMVGRSLSDTDQSNSSSGLVRTRRNVNILMMNQAGAIMQICTLVGALPIGWKAPAFQADSAGVAIEEMTLAYEGIQLQFQTETETLAAGGASVSLTRDDLGFFPDN